MAKGLKRCRSCLDLTQLEIDALKTASSDRLMCRSLSGGGLDLSRRKRLKLIKKFTTLHLSDHESTTNPYRRVISIKTKAEIPVNPEQELVTL